MAPRNNPLPEATTESAREARRAFFCDLCQKGYSRQTEFDVHENSYDHQHRKRLKEMRQLTKDPNAAAKARAAEREEGGLKAVSLPLASAGGTTIRKKPVFKSTLQPHNAAVLGQPVMRTAPTLFAETADPSGAIRNGWYEDRYQPRYVTGCDKVGCGVCRTDGRKIDLGELQE